MVEMLEGLMEKIKYIGKPRCSAAVKTQSDFPLVVSFFTVDPIYEKEADRFIKTLKAFDIEYDIRGLEPSTAWRLNSNMKWPFIIGMMKEYPTRDIVWMDVDSRIRKYPIKLKEINCELALHFIDWKKYPDVKRVPRDCLQAACGVVYIKNTEKMHSFMNEFLVLRKKSPLVPDAVIMKDFVKQIGNKVDVFNLPATYCQIFDQMHGAGDPVIEQMQASRKLKRFNCTCRRGFDSEEQFMTHMTIHAGDARHVPDLCHKNTKSIFGKVGN